VPHLRRSEPSLRAPLDPPQTKEGETQMYGHPPHTGIGAMVLTLVASAKGGIGYLVRVIAHTH
jgi:hypothetical protein